jgi:TRAP-type C4-dicarboxylate transport system permease small subunit
VFHTFLLLPLLLFGLCLVFLTLAILFSWDIDIKVDLEGSSANFDFTLPVVSWAYYALFTGLVSAAFALLLRRLIIAWKKRSRKPGSSQGQV